MRHNRPSRALVKRILASAARRVRDRRGGRSALRREYALDFQRYKRHYLKGEVSEGVSGKNLEAQLTKDYHRVEKGLALQSPKRPFGKELAERLSSILSITTDSSHPSVEYGTSALKALQDWNDLGARSDTVSPIRGGRAHPLVDAEAFFEGRRSVRDFEPRFIDPVLLDRAVSLAINTPSVCNRQAWRVRFFHQGKAKSVLKFQNGNRGWGETVPVVAVVTVDSRLFSGAGERNQVWIEGGLFSMTLVWALHATGLDTCMLNMSVGNARATALREHCGMADYELVIMMVAVGYGREGHRVARSPRRSLEEVRRGFEDGSDKPPRCRRDGTS